MTLREELKDIAQVLPLLWKFAEVADKSPIFGKIWAQELSAKLCDIEDALRTLPKEDRMGDVSSFTLSCVPSE